MDFFFEWAASTHLYYELEGSKSGALYMDISLLTQSHLGKFVLILRSLQHIYNACFYHCFVIIRFMTEQKVSWWFPVEASAL